MKNITVILLLVLSGSTCYAQPAAELIDEQNVSRIMKALSADAMMGRPASNPKLIEPATAFLEKEFQVIGLKPLPGLTGYRQQFEKHRIRPGASEVIVDARKVQHDQFLIVSEKKELRFTQGLGQREIQFDSTIANPDQYFVSKALQELRDTTSAIVWVSPEFTNGFARLKRFYGERFSNNSKFDKVFILATDPGSSYSIKATQKIETIRMANVVGILEGKSRKDEYVIFSAHYDHIGVQKSVNGDSIANGADDDASGTTAVLELANYYRKTANNNRTLIFVAFTAEEIGGFGSRYFSEQIDPEKVVAMFNIEMIGKPSKWGLRHAFITGFERSDFGAILQKNVKESGFTFMPDPYPDQNLFYRSDNATLARLGVPAHSISTDQIDSDELYHSVDDEFETTDLANITSTIQAIAAGARTIVEGTDTPSRIDKLQVRPGRN